MMLPTENEAYRVDADNGDGAYTCTPYWARHPSPHTTIQTGRSHKRVRRA